MRRRFDWAQTKWQYIGWSNVDWRNIPGKQFVVMTVRGMIISLLERHGLVSDTQLSQYMHTEMGYPMSLKAVRNHLKTLERYGLIRPITTARAEDAEVQPEIKQVELESKTLQPSHFVDAAFLTKGRVTQHSKTRLGIVIVAVLEVKHDSKGNRTRGRKFAYVFPGKTETTNDLVKALDLARRHQRVTCIQTDRRPLYGSKRFQVYLLKNQINIIQKKDFGSMVFIDGMFGEWKNKYVHPHIRRIEKMTAYDRLEYVVRTLKECFSDIIIATPSLKDIFGQKQ